MEKREDRRICSAEDEMIGIHNEKFDRILSAINLKEPDRVPIVPFIDHPGYWPKHIGISLNEFMFDFRKSEKAISSAIRDLNLDAHTAYCLPITGQLIQQLKFAEDFISIPSEDKPPSYGIWQWNSLSQTLVSSEDYDYACKEPLAYMQKKVFPMLVGESKDLSVSKLRFITQRVLKDCRRIRDLWDSVDQRYGTPLFNSGIGFGPVELGVF